MLRHLSCRPVPLGAVGDKVCTGWLWKLTGSEQNDHFVDLKPFMSADSRMRFGLQIVFVFLYITPSHYHHCANFILGHWTYKMPVRYNLWSVWVRFSILSQLSITHYVGLCVFSLPFSLVMIERIYKLCLIIIIKSEVWTITHCLGLSHVTMVCAVRLPIFLLNQLQSVSSATRKT